MKYPNKWGQGAIFAFSGLDGFQDFTDNYPTTLLSDSLGVRFYLNKTREFRFELNKVKNIKHYIVASDIIKSNLHLDRKGVRNFDFCMMWANSKTIVGYTAENATPIVFGGKMELLDSGVLINSAESVYSALCTRTEGERVFFSFAISMKNIESAVCDARDGLDVDVVSLEKQKLTFYDNLKAPDNISEAEERTLAKCFSIMKSQVMSSNGFIKSRWTTPDRIPHRKIWIWDSVFHSFGNSHIDFDLAYESIKAVLDGQREDGFIPIFFSPLENEITHATQPPVLAWGIKELFDKTGNRAYVDDVFDHLEAYLRWDLKNRDSNHNFLLEWARRDNVNLGYSPESGMDNCSRFDKANMLECVDFTTFFANDARCLSYLAEKTGRTEQAQFWNEVYEKIKNAVNTELYNSADGLYYDKEVGEECLRDIKAVTCFIPVMAGIPSKEQAERLAMHLENKDTFGTTNLVSSIGLDDKTFSTDMWRGPMWVNYSYMISKGFREYGLNEIAEKIERSVINCITRWYMHDGVIYEYYDSLDRGSPSRNDRKGANIQPYDPGVRIACIRDYGWSASLFADLLLSSERR